MHKYITPLVLVSLANPTVLFLSQAWSFCVLYSSENNFKFSTYNINDFGDSWFTACWQFCNFFSKILTLHTFTNNLVLRILYNNWNDLEYFFEYFINTMSQVRTQIDCDMCIHQSWVNFYFTSTKSTFIINMPILYTQNVQA